MRRTKNQTLYGREVNKINGHACNLPTAEDPVSLYVNEGWCVMLRRKIKKFLVADDVLKRSKTFYRSTSKLTSAQLKQLRFAYYIIHPFSKFRFYWEICIGIVFFLSFYYFPLLHLDIFEQDLLMEFIAQVFDMFFFLQVIIECLSGYYDRKTETIVMNFGQILRHYATGSLLFDVIAAIPKSAMTFILPQVDDCYLKALRHFSRLMRLSSTLRYFERFAEEVNLSFYIIQLIKTSTQLSIFMLYVSYTIYESRAWFGEVAAYAGNSPSYGLLRSITSTMKTFFLVQPSSYDEPNQALIQFLLMNLGNLFDGLLYAMFWRMYNRTSMVNNKYDRLTGQIQEYSKFRELPESMHKMLLEYIDFKFGRRIYDEQLILNTLTPHMTDELFYLYSKQLVENVQLFEGMPTFAIKRIAARLKPEIFLPNDVIMQAGHEGTSMYFIIAGIVAVYTSAGKEICHLTDGANFGEIALLMNETRTASIVAADFCELFRLNRKDFQEAIEPFPELMAKMVHIAKERYTNILSFPGLDH